MSSSSIVDAANATSTSEISSSSSSSSAAPLAAPAASSSSSSSSSSASPFVLTCTTPSALLFESKFARSKHSQFVMAQDKATDTFEYYVGEHLRMSGVYWCLMAMDLIGDLQSMPIDDIVQWLLTCRDDATGGFAGNVGHDVHLLYTLSAIQILAILDRLELIDAEKVGTYIASLQQPDGSFVGDQWGEVDTRFSYCALNAAAVIGQSHKLNINKAVEYIARCRNFDGGFGSVPGAESHAGQIFCCVASLAICGDDALKEVDAGLVGWWLAERQLPTGGLNGRPEKKQDVCYSWWVLSSLSILGHVRWIDGAALTSYILSCQENDAGGFSDRPGNMADVFHTYFGIAGLSLLGNENLSHIDPVYALPKRVVDKLKLHTRYSTV